MPTTDNKYYPALSDIITTDDLPDFLGFIKDGLETVFDKIYFKDYQVSKSITGSSAFYSLSIVSRKKLALELPGTGIFFVLNPDYNDSTISSFPITVFWQWEVMRYIRYFNLNDFSFTPEDFYNLSLEVLNLDEDQAIQLAISTFVVQTNPSLTKFGQLVADINTLYGSTIVIDETLPNKIEELIVQVELLNKNIFPTVFALYILQTGIDQTKDKINTFFASFIPNDIEEYIKEIIIPKARVTLDLSAAMEFPNNILKPVNPDGSEIPNQTTKFLFAQAQLYVDTVAGIGYQLELAGSLMPSSYAEIGNTGILLQIESLKLDLSKKTNIPEADADGRPSDFVGVYARAISITLPSRWFHDDTVAGTASTTLRLGGYDLLVGTGGISGTIALETVPSVVSGGNLYYFENKFQIHFPVTVFQKNPTTNVIEEIVVQDITNLKTFLFPTGATNIPTCPLKFPISVSEPDIASGVVKTFDSLSSYQQYLSSFPNDNVNPNDKVPTLWKKIGSETNGFRVGFNKFDITFKQNKVISSNIKGALEIKKFVYPQNATYPNGDIIQYPTPVHIDIEGHLHDNGDFNLTASAAPPYPIEFPGVFIYHLKSVELGKEGKNFYIGTSGAIEFQGFLKDTLHLDKIDIDRLRIYSDGSIELEGGSIHLTSPIVLKLGPVDITVTAIHYGSHQKEYDGVMRKFNYFGFDGGISVDPLGIEIRGDGVKFYYCVDDVTGHEKPDSYLHIQTIYLDLTIPSKTPVAIINGWLSIPEPGVSKEYVGGLKLQLPEAKITGSVDMKLMPKYPAFIVDASLDFPAPIPLGPVGIYGFRGLFGYRYVAEKEAIGLVSDVDSWYDYYKAPERGINVRKFNGPDKTVHSGTPISIGAGASLGTSADNGTILNIKAMVLISIPSLFMIDGRAAVLSARLGLENTQEPPFFAFIAFGDDSLELGIGADFRMPTKPSTLAILKLYADIQAGFFFKNQKPWYINIGTKSDPVVATIVEILTIKSYVMLSAGGIQGGARGELNFDKNFAGIHVWANCYIEIGGRISFEKPQFGAYLAAGVDAGIDLWGIITFGLAIHVTFTVEAPKPFKIHGTLYYSVTLDFWLFSITYSGDIDVTWEFNSEVNIDPINPMINPDNSNQLDYLVRGVNMLSNEQFDLAYLGDGPLTNTLDSKILSKIIPLDTYIDIKTEKGFLPNAVGNLIGGINNPPARYTDLVPPDSSVLGYPIRQVIHEYSIHDLVIKSWNPVAVDPLDPTIIGRWDDYNPYKALYTTDPNPVLNTLKVGQFQKDDGQYNKIRVLGTTPFSYTEQGQPGWYTPEQYGITQTTLTCQSELIDHQCADFVLKILGEQYHCYNPNEMFYSNNVAFLLYDRFDDDNAYITNLNNLFLKVKSLAFNNRNKLRLILPQPSGQVGLKLTTTALSVKIKYYCTRIDATTSSVQYGSPDPNAVDPNAPYEIILNSSSLHSSIEYNHTDWKPVTKIEIEPLFVDAVSQQIQALNEQIELINYNNALISLGQLGGDLQSTSALEDQLHDLLCNDGVNLSASFINRYTKPDALNYYYSKEFIENDLSFIYSLGTTEKNGLISKIQPNGDLVWERSYIIDSSKKPLIFKRIIQLNNTESNTPAEHYFQYVVYANAGPNQYLISINFETGDVLWVRQISWKDEDVLVHIEPSKIDFNFYLTISDRNQIDTNTFPTVAQIDGNGNFINGRLLIIEGEEFIINAIDTDEKGLVAAGRYIKEDSIGTIIRLDANLKIVDSLQITSPNTTIQDIKIIGANKYLISGYNNKYDTVFVSIISDTGALLINNFPESKNHGSVLQLNRDGFYLLLTTDTTGILHKLDLEFNLIWTKEIEFEGDTNGIRNFTFNTTTEKITLNAYNQEVKSLVIHTDKDFQSCLTLELQNQILKRSESNVEHLKVSLKETGIDLKEVGTKLKILTSEKIEICPKTATGCGEKDELICSLYTKIETIYKDCFINPNQGDSIKFKDITNCSSSILELLFGFNAANPNFNLTALLEQQIGVIKAFIEKPDLLHYTDAWTAVQSILDYLNHVGNCICKCGDDSCVENEAVCAIYNQILAIYENLLAYQTTLPQSLNNSSASSVIDLLNTLPQSILTIEELKAYFDRFKASSSKNEDQFVSIDTKGYDGLLTWLLNYGNCNCSDQGAKITMLHEVCWMSMQDYIYNINVPSQEAISLDAQATIDGLTKFIQPIWRPDTSYLIRFILKDKVDGNSNTSPFVFNYGFTTAGPVGYFHTNQKSTYGTLLLQKNQKLLKEDNDYYEVTADGLKKVGDTVNYVTNSNGLVLEDTTGYIKDAATGSYLTHPNSNPPINIKVVAHADKYALTSLKQYIDYNRSYPNADGNLLSAKPLFYDDEDATKITLFFSKAYVTNFFRRWDSYNGVGPFEGMLKIVIKDPREDISIINPPALDIVVDTIEIAQTTQEWNLDDNPQIPFVLSQYANLFGNGGCTGIIETIKPKSEYIVVTPKKLKPSKLYTAIVNNMYDLNHNGALENTVNETREVHKFVFQTSQYKSFKEQVLSYLISKDVEGEAAQLQAIFSVTKALDPEEILAAYETIKGINPIAVGSYLTQPMVAILNNNYQHRYDRIFEGIFGLSPLDKPISTEFNFIKDSISNKVIALIIKNPEPFNNPKIPYEDVKKCLIVLNGTTEDNSYKVLLSKDYSQAIIMNDTKVIPNGNLKIQFQYKIWNGTNYKVPDEPNISHPKYTVVVEVPINN